jgi:hypothetical protein
MPARCMTSTTTLFQECQSSNVSGKFTYCSSARPDKSRRCPSETELIEVNYYIVGHCCTKMVILFLNGTRNSLKSQCGPAGASNATANNMFELCSLFISSYYVLDVSLGSFPAGLTSSIKYSISVSQNSRSLHKPEIASVTGV